jgi:hypothetical protein
MMMIAKAMVLVMMILVPEALRQVSLLHQCKHQSFHRLRAFYLPTLPQNWEASMSQTLPKESSIPSEARLMPAWLSQARLSQAGIQAVFQAGVQACFQTGSQADSQLPAGFQADWQRYCLFYRYNSKEHAVKTGIGMPHAASRI